MKYNIYQTHDWGYESVSQGLDLQTWIWVPSTHIKYSGTDVHLCYNGIGKRMEKDLFVWWPGSLAELMSSRFNERYYLTKLDQDWLEKIPQINLCALNKCIHVHVLITFKTVACIYLNRHTHTQIKTSKTFGNDIYSSGEVACTPEHLYGC